LTTSPQVKGQRSKVKGQSWFGLDALLAEGRFVTVREWTSDFELTQRERAGNFLRMTTQRSRSTWKRLVAKVERGRSVSDVALEHGVSPKTLSWWKWRLKQEPDVQTAEPSFLPVVVREVALRDEKPREVRFELADLQLRIEVGTDPSYVAALVGALRGC